MGRFYLSAQDSDVQPQPSSEKKGRKRLYIGSVIIVAVLIFILLNLQPIIAFLQNLVVVLPISYSHEELVAYTLALINADRTKFGRSNVTLSPVSSGQEHADDMLSQHFFSHWDTAGLKPYMRYTLAGGVGVVQENVAWEYGTGPFDVKESLRYLESLMMYNDSAWNWGHRDNILDQYHNRVSIGVSYDRNNVYLVQDFENEYIQWSTLNVTQAGEVTMEGTLTISQTPLRWVSIYYDPLPTNLSTAQLKMYPYNESYSSGTFVGMALPPGYTTLGITITAQTWSQTGSSFQIRFSLSKAFNAYGAGVYTLYLQPDPSSMRDPLTSYSAWLL